jgi:hypothetical protein
MCFHPHFSFGSPDSGSGSVARQDAQNCFFFLLVLADWCSTHTIVRKLIIGCSVFHTPTRTCPHRHSHPLYRCLDSSHHQYLDDLRYSMTAGSDVKHAHVSRPYSKFPLAASPVCATCPELNYSTNNAGDGTGWISRITRLRLFWCCLIVHRWDSVNGENKETNCNLRIIHLSAKRGRHCT